MSAEIRFPNITAVDNAGKLLQVQSYLHQLVQQLNFALQEVDVRVVTAIETALPTASQVSAEEQARSSFNAIKALIIKSADIVNAYYDEISKKLEGVYVAESDFGVYAEATQALITANANAIEQRYANLQQIITDLDVRVSEISTNAYIRSGLLGYYDSGENEGAPIYGIEVGQTTEQDGETTFDKFARFTANRLSFFDSNDYEVAYVSDYKLVITNAEIKGTLKLGGYEIDTTDGLAFNWVGRE